MKNTIENKSKSQAERLEFNAVSIVKSCKHYCSDYDGLFSAGDWSVKERDIAIEIAERIEEIKGNSMGGYKELNKACCEFSVDSNFIEYSILQDSEYDIFELWSELGRPDSLYDIKSKKPIELMRTACIHNITILRDQVIYEILYSLLTDEEKEIARKNDNDAMIEEYKEYVNIL